MRRLFPIPLVVLLLTACGGGGSSPSASSSGPPSSQPSQSAAPSTSGAPPASVSEAPIPSDDLGEFSCEYPIVEDATVARANITDVRVGEHADYDRVVFEFEQGLPEITLDRASPPFTQDASGMPINVDGTSFLRLTMRGGTKQTESGTSSYDGPTNFDPAMSTLVDLVEGGDFEGQSTWYLGLSTDACARVIRLEDDNGNRLVIDLQH
jgi:hypothetical protein